jgi:hypothetical protein
MGGNQNRFQGLCGSDPRKQPQCKCARLSRRGQTAAQTVVLIRNRIQPHCRAPGCDWRECDIEQVVLQASWTRYLGAERQRGRPSPGDVCLPSSAPIFLLHRGRVFTPRSTKAMRPRSRGETSQESFPDKRWTKCHWLCKIMRDTVIQHHQDKHRYAQPTNSGPAQCGRDCYTGCSRQPVHEMPLPMRRRKSR